MRNSNRKSPLRCRSLNIESLEARELLCASPLHQHDGNTEHDAEHAEPIACQFDFAQYAEADIDIQAGRDQFAGSYDIADAFTLHSDYESKYRIYLDFNGFISDRSWNDFDEDYWDIDGDKTTFSDAELENIIQIWQIVSSRFSTFDIDVTTDVAMFDEVDNPLLMKSGNGDTDGWGIRVVMGAEGDFGGVAYVGSFDWDTDTPCYAVDYGGLSAASVITHEVGHTIGLGHDGLIDEAGEEHGYYGGHQVTDVRTGTSAKWGPIMGSPYTGLEQYCIGDYTGANNQEDDLAIITRYIAYRPDRDIEFVRDDTVQGLQIAEGGIETSGDIDSTTFTVGEKRKYTFEAVSGVTIGTQQVSSLYYVMTLTNDTTGEVVFQKYSPLDTFKVSYEGDLTAGVYTLSIAGAGVEPTEDMQGFSNYGSIGTYTITVESKVFVDVPVNFRVGTMTWNTARLEWDAPAKSVTGYVVEYRKALEEGWTSVSINRRNITSYLLEGLEPDTEYEFRLRAINGIAVSEWSPIVTGRTTETPPTVPGNFRSPNQTVDSIFLAWNFQSVTLQTLQYRQTGQTEWTDWSVDAVDTSVSITGLNADTSYDFRINVANSGGTSGWATLNGIRTKGLISDWPIPADPEGFQSIVQTADSVTLSWKSQTGITRYELQYKETTDTEWTTISVSTFNTSRVIHNLQSGTDYQFQLRAVNMYSPSDWQAISVTTTISAPVNLKAQPLASRNVNLTWDAVSGAASYQVYWKLSDGTERLLKTTTDTKYTTARLSIGENTLRVYALTNNIKSDAAEVTVTIGTIAPAAPLNLQAEPQISRNVNLIWDAVPGATSYQIYWKLSDGTERLLGTTKSITYSTARLSVGENTLRVYALVNNVKSHASEVTTIVGTALPAPSNLQAEPLASRNVNLTWDAVPGATSYQVYWKLSNGTERLLKTTTSTNYTTARLPVGENTLCVYALVGNVKSQASEVTTIVGTALLTPSNLQAEPQISRNVNLTWTVVPNATHYQIYWKNTSGKNVVIGTSETASFRTPRVANGVNTFYVYAWSGKERSASFATVTTTVGAAPSSARSLKLLERVFVEYENE